MVNTVWSTISTYLAEYGLNVLAAILIAVVGRWLAGVLSRLLERIMEQAQVDATLTRFVKHLTYIGLLAFVALSALSRLGIQTTSFIAVLGAAGLAVGLALQGSLSNFAAGVLMIIFRPFQVGDFIEAARTSGTVQEIQIFNTVLTTEDNCRVIIPNASITAGNITNYSSNPTRRLDLTVDVAYGEDLKRAKQLLEEVVGREPLVLKEPNAVIAVSGFGDTRATFNIQPWVNAADYEDAKRRLIEQIKVELDRNDLTIPAAS